jgi:uncharacterized protein (DUF885 family)
MVWRVTYLQAIANHENIHKFKFKMALINKVNMDEDQLVFADHEGNINTDLDLYSHLERVANVPKLLDPELEAGQKIQEHLARSRTLNQQGVRTPGEDITKLINQFPSVMPFIPTEELMLQLIKTAARLKDETDINLMVNPREKNNDARILPLRVNYES